MWKHFGLTFRALVRRFPLSYHVWPAERLSVCLLFKVLNLNLLVVTIRQLQIMSCAHFESWRNSEPSAVRGNVLTVMCTVTVRKVLSASCRSSSDVCGSSRTRRRLLHGPNGHVGHSQQTDSRRHQPLSLVQVSSSLTRVMLNFHSSQKGGQSF